MFNVFTAKTNIVSLFLASFVLTGIFPDTALAGCEVLNSKPSDLYDLNVQQNAKDNPQVTGWILKALQIDDNRSSNYRPMDMTSRAFANLMGLKPRIRFLNKAPKLTQGLAWYQDVAGGISVSRAVPDRQVAFMAFYFDKKYSGHDDRVQFFLNFPPDARGAFTLFLQNSGIDSNYKIQTQEKVPSDFTNQGYEFTFEGNIKEPNVAKFANGVADFVARWNSGKLLPHD